MALTHPRDLDAWRRWQSRRNIPRLLVSTLRRESPLVLGVPTADTQVLVALDSTSPTSRAALEAPLAHLQPPAGALTASTITAATAPSTTSSTTPSTTSAKDGSPGQARVADPGDPAAWDDVLPDLRVVLALGHYLPVGGFAHALARHRGLPFVTVQHGLLAPSMAPLAPGTHLLAWSEADAEMWRSDRNDVTTQVVGSQLLWAAAQLPRLTPSDDTRPVYLGQLHGAELPRRANARSAGTFCLAEHAAYRPHPAERDRRSRAQHRRWARQGIEVDTSGVPLTELLRPVVSAFSTGVLEAAARGLPAWVHHDDPPEWLREFWARYDMHRWGEEPTPAPALATGGGEPARAVSDAVTDLLEGAR